MIKKFNEFKLNENFKGFKTVEIPEWLDWVGFDEDKNIEKIKIQKPKGEDYTYALLSYDDGGNQLKYLEGFFASEVLYDNQDEIKAEIKKAKISTSNIDNGMYVVVMIDKKESMEAYAKKDKVFQEMISPKHILS